MKLNVLYFAHVRSRVGIEREPIDCPDGATVHDVVELLGDLHPELVPLLPGVRVAVNGSFVDDGATVPDGAEFVLIPPVSGGGGWPRVALTEEELDDDRMAALADQLLDDSVGAVVTFAGVVRAHARGRVVERIEYQAYREMAARQLEALVAEVEASVAGSRLAVHHRIGTLSVGETAVIIVAASAHRAEAFDACRRLIDRIKQDVPIWKREIGPDGDEWVSEGA